VTATSSALPRLTLRFAIYTAVGLSLGAALIVLFVRSYTLDQAAESVKRHSRVVAAATLAEQLRARDFTQPVNTKRRAQLDRIFRARVLTEGIVDAVFIAPDGNVTYATDSARIARRSQDASEVRRVFDSTALRTRVDTHEAKSGTQKVMKVFVPARFDGGRARGVLVLSHDWEPFLKDARNTAIVIFVVLELVLLALYLFFFPPLRRVTRRLGEHSDLLEAQALYNGVTGLPTRSLFRDRAEQALLRADRSGEGVAVMLISLERMKHIDETIGRETTNQLLRELAERVSAALRATDTFARLGPDQFAVVTPGADEDELTMLAERTVAVLERPFFLDALELDVDARVGIALYPRDGGDVSTLVLRADIALDDARESHARYAFYKPDREETDDAPPTLASGLRAAIEAGELTLDFQPTFDLRSGAIVRAEALVRWRHPERGPLQPEDFLAEAVETRQTPALTRWVLDSALRECSAWQKKGWRLPVAVNVDMRSLLGESFVHEVELALNRNGIEPELLELEITEEAVVAEPVAVANVASRLNEFGVRLVLDDFGGGLSSIASLQGLPIHGVKIDRSLVARLGQDSTVKPIVGSILSLGNTLGLSVIAEGIQTKRALRSVLAAKCRFGQGFVLAQPVPAEEFMLVLEYTFQQEPAAATA
jgi:diguanylate cyclase (GGDEF)-like protein